MWSQQIIVAFLCAFLASQQVAAVVNSGQTSKVEESKTSSLENDGTKSTSAKDSDLASATTEEKADRREAPLGDVYGPPLPVPTDSYLPSGTSNINLPVPVYGVPDAPINNIIYPAPPPDIPPPVALPSYGLPLVSNNFGAPITTSVSTVYLPPSNGFSANANAIKFEGSSVSSSTFLGPPRGLKPNYGPPPPRSQYGPPRKPQFPSKYPSKYPFNKGGFGIHKQVKPLSTYGPPTGYFKDNYSSSKFKFNGNSQNNFLSNINTFTQNSFSGHSNIGGQALLTQYGVPNIGYGVPNGGYGVPNIGIESHSTNLNLVNNNHGLSNTYGTPDVSVQVIPGDFGHGGHDSHSISTQYGPPGSDILGPPKPQYGPPQPSPHPKPPHPGAPAPPTPPDIKYDGWQPIPGLVSRAPTGSYGAPPTGHGHGHGTTNIGFNKDLLPPPLESLDHHQQSSSGYGSIALANSYNSHKQVGVSDSYGAPLNTVTGSGGVVSSSGEEVHGQHLSQNRPINIDIGQDVNAIKSIGIEIYPTGSGSGSIGGHGQSAVEYNVHIPDTYSAPPLNSYSSGGPYAAAHSYNNFGAQGSSSLGFGSLNAFNNHHSFNSHKSHGYKGSGSSFGSGRGLIPPSGVYGVPPNGQYGTPLFTNTPHGPHLNALKINPPRHPVVHREPVPPGIFDSITKGGYKHHSHLGSSHGFGSTYLPPPVSDIPKPTRDRTPPSPSSLYSLPNSHSSISFQNFAQGSSSAGLQNLNLNLDGGHASLSSYNVPLNVVDGSYNLPHTSSNLGSEVVGLDLSHPSLTIDLTQNNGIKNSFSQASDCTLHKTQSLPSLSYGVPSVNSYTASLSSLTTNIGGAHHHVNSGPTVDISYEVTEPQSHGHDSYDLNVAHSQKVTSTAKANSIESEKSEGKAYGKTVAKSFGPHSELLQSQSIDLNNINLQGALGSYTLQIQSADGGQSQVPHDQLLNDELLQSILAAIEQPQKNGQSIRQPIIQVQKSLEKQNFITNDTIPTVVGKVTDAEIEHSSPLQYVVEPSNELHTNVTDNIEQVQEGDHESNIRLLPDNDIALYFSNKQRSKKEATEANFESKKSSVSNSH